MRECVEKVLGVGQRLTMEDMKAALKKGNLRFLHGDKESRPAIAMYLSLSARRSRRGESEPVKNLVEGLRRLKELLPGWATEAGGPSALIYLNRSKMVSLPPVEVYQS